MTRPDRDSMLAVDLIHLCDPGESAAKEGSHRLGGSLEVFTGFEPDPDFQHRGVTLADVLQERSSAAFGTELAENREGAVTCELAR